VEQELKDAGEEVIPKSLVAGAILAGMGNRYTTCRDLLQALPKEQQTKEVFGQRLLEAEKNEKINAEIALLTMGASVNAATNPPGTHLPGPSTRKVCGYIRKRQGRNAWNKPWSECLKYHTGSAWVKLDDERCAANPTKTPADLPDRLQALRCLRAEPPSPSISRLPPSPLDPRLRVPRPLGTFPDLGGAGGAGVHGGLGCSHSSHRDQTQKPCLLHLSLEHY